MKHSAKNLAVIATASVLMAFGTLAAAAPITYQVSAVSSGTLGALPFTNELVTLTLSADTSNVAVTPLGGVVNLGTAKVNVPGIGEGTVTEPTAIFSSVTPFVPDVGFPFLILLCQ